MSIVFEPFGSSYVVMATVDDMAELNALLDECLEEYGHGVIYIDGEQSKII